MRDYIKYIFLYFLGGLALLFIVAPILNLYFSTELNELFAVTRDSEATESMALTLFLSFAATVICALFAVPLSWLLARSKSRWKNVITAIVNIPVVIPHSAAGIALLGLVSRDSAVGNFADSLGLSFIDHSLGIAFAMAYVSIPFLIISAINGFSDVPEKLENAARNLGASEFRVFLKISLPLARRQIISGMVMMFSRGISEFGAVIILAYFPTITPILIYDRFNTGGLADSGPIAAIFILICLAVFFLLYFLNSERKKRWHD